MKYHGGFQVGEEVEVRFRGYHKWEKGFIVVNFYMLRVAVTNLGEEYSVSIFHIRKPNIRI